MTVSGAAHAGQTSGLRSMVANLTAGLRRVAEPRWAAPEVSSPEVSGLETAAPDVTRDVAAQVSNPSDARLAVSTAELTMDPTAFQARHRAEVPLELSGPVFQVTTTAGLSAQRTSVEQTVQALSRHLEEAPGGSNVGWLIMTPDGSSYSGQVDTGRIAEGAELYLASLSEHVERLNAAMIRDHISAMQGHPRSVDETRLIP